MSKLHSTFLLLSACCAGTVAAEPSQFQGAFGQLGIGYESVSPTHNSSTLAINNVSIPVTSASSSTSNITGTISLGWYQQISERFLLGLGVDYSPFAGSSGNMSVSTTGALPGQNNITNDYNYQKKDSYNIFLSPAVLVGTDGMAYAKIGYTGAKVNYYNSLTYNLQGYSLGLGYKHMFAKGWYGFVEGNYANYGSQTKTATNPVAQGRTLTSSGTNGMTSYNLLVGVGYKF